MGMMARHGVVGCGAINHPIFGAIVFNLVEANLMSKTDKDDLNDFHNVYDLDQEPSSTIIASKCLTEPKEMQ